MGLKSKLVAGGAAVSTLMGASAAFADTAPTQASLLECALGNVAQAIQNDDSRMIMASKEISSSGKITAAEVRNSAKLLFGMQENASHAAFKVSEITSGPNEGNLMVVISDKQGLDARGAAHYVIVNPENGQLTDRNGKNVQQLVSIEGRQDMGSPAYEHMREAIAGCLTPGGGK